jgi:hypothetical protein
MPPGKEVRKMIQRIDNYDFIRAFEDYGRSNQFTEEALEILFEYYEEIDEDTELDVIAICCEWSEYESIEELHKNYGVKDESPEECLERIEGETTVLYTYNGYIIADF